MYDSWPVRVHVPILPATAIIGNIFILMKDYVTASNELTFYKNMAIPSSTIETS